MNEFQIQLALGEKVLEMADRLSTMDKIMPGTKAEQEVEIDDSIYTISVEKRTNI